MNTGTRRALLTTTGMLASTALAGCMGDDGDDSPVDRTGQDTVDVIVGAGNGLEYDPAHITVDVGTTVIWEWSGQGGGHDVAETNGVFESELVDEAGYTFEYTFDEPGTYEYVCTPHQTSGMVGSVQVSE